MLIFSYISLASTENCLNKIDAPLCPNSGATILDETYPTQAYVISVSPFAKNEPSEKLPSDFVISLLASYGQNKPDIFVPAKKKDYDLLITQITQNLIQKKIPLEEINLQLSFIKHIENDSYTWQQDYFESFVSLTSGLPLLREISSYNRLRNGFRQTTLNGLKNLSLICNMEIGEPLSGSTFSKKNGEMGGNIEGLPGGLCLKGDNQADEYINQYCGSHEKGNFVNIEVSWLNVGHVDEVIKVVPTFPALKPQECNFSIWLASPKKGLELLKDPQLANQNFIDLSNLSKLDLEKKLSDIIKTKTGKFLCNLLSHFNEPAKLVPINNKDQSVKGAQIWHILNLLSIQNVYAGIEPINQEDSCLKKLTTITNKQMIDLMENDKDFLLTNNLIQEKMDKNKEQIQIKLKERLPQCTNIKFENVPDLFYGHGIAEVNNKKELPTPGNIRSLFPNPTNSVLANQTMILSKTPNENFNQYMKKLLTTQGMKTTLVDTWNYAHAGDGNMHCSSHSITYCRPRGMK